MFLVAMLVLGMLVFCGKMFIDSFCDIRDFVMKVTPDKYCGLVSVAIKLFVTLLLIFGCFKMQKEFQDISFSGHPTGKKSDYELSIEGKLTEGTRKDALPKLDAKNGLDKYLILFKSFKDKVSYTTADGKFQVWHDSKTNRITVRHNIGNANSGIKNPVIYFDTDGNIVGYSLQNDSHRDDLAKRSDDHMLANKDAELIKEFMDALRKIGANEATR